MTEITDENFEKEVLEKSKKIPVLVDFWAEWCPPCKMLTPVLDKITDSDEYKDKFKLVKCNVENAREKASEYGVMSIPNVQLFKNSKVSDQFIGAQPEANIKQFLEKNIDK